MVNSIEKHLLKNYDSYSSPQKYGIRCMVHFPDGSYPLHRHDYFEIEYIYDGEMEHELNGIRETLKKGSCYALAPDDIHRFTVTKPIVIRNLGIYYKDAPPQIQKLINREKLPHTAQIPPKKMQIIDEWFFKIRECIESNCQYSLERITAYTTLLLTTIFDISKPLIGQKLSGGYKYIARALDFIEDNFAQPISLEDVSSHVNLTPNYFSRLFKEICGCTFLDYLTNHRIEKAKIFLTATDKSITEIAFACGFGSFSSFSRAFKSICNCRPNDYRKFSAEYNHEVM